MRKSSLPLIALATLAFVAPVQAQLLGGSGNLAGDVGGTLDRSGGMVGGTLSGSGRIDGSVPVDRATGRIDAVRERAARRAEAARARAEATGADVSARAEGTARATADRAAGESQRGVALAGAVQGAAQGTLERGERAATTPPMQEAPARRPLLPSLAVDGSAEGDASASASRDAGVNASADGSARGDARVKRGNTDAAASTTRPGTSADTPRRKAPAAADRDRESMGGGR